MSLNNAPVSDEKLRKTAALVHVVMATKNTRRRKTGGYKRFILPVGAEVVIQHESAKARAKRLRRRTARKYYLKRTYLDTVKINLTRRYKIAQTIDIAYLQNLAERAKRRAMRNKERFDKQMAWVASRGPDYVPSTTKLTRQQRLRRFFRRLPKWMKIYLYIHERPKWLYSDKKFFRITGLSPRQLWFIADMYRRNIVVFPMNAHNNEMLKRAARYLHPPTVRRKIVTIDEWRRRRLARRERNIEWWKHNKPAFWQERNSQETRYKLGLAARGKKTLKRRAALQKKLSPEEFKYRMHPHTRPTISWPQKWLYIVNDKKTIKRDANQIVLEWEPNGIFRINVEIGETPVEVKPLFVKHNMSMHLANSGYRMYTPFVPGKLYRKTINRVLHMYRVFETEEDRVWFNYLVENYDDVIQKRRNRFALMKYRKIRARKMYFERKWSAVHKRSWWVPPLRNWNSYNWLQEEVAKKFPEAKQRKLDLLERNPMLETQKRFLQRWWWDDTEKMNGDKLREFVVKEVEDTAEQWKAGKLKTGRGTKKK